MADFLKKQVALVTGASRRLGRATALALAHAGADIVVHCNRSECEASETVELIKAQGRRAWVLRGDLADTRCAEQLFDAACKVAGDKIDILINNASIFNTGRPCEMTVDELNLNMNIHVLSPLALSRCLARQGCPGNIINMLDTRILDCDNEHSAYHISKRSLFTLTRMLAVELAPTIRVNAVAPGLVLPPPGENEEYLKQRCGSLPLQRYGSEQDVTQAIIFLLQGGFITGQVIYIDGGRHLRGNSYEL